MIRKRFLLLTVIMMLIANGIVNARVLEPIDGFYKKIFSRTFASNGVDLFVQKYPMLCFPTQLETQYPKLVRAFSDYNEGLIKAAKAERTEIVAQARQRHSEAPQYFSAFFSDNDLLIRRADSYVVSLINEFRNYSGGAHGMYGWYGVNFDSETGKRLTVSDICTDANKLYTAIIKRLYADHDNRAFDNLDGTLMKLIVEDTINFVIEPRGVTFIFNPYEIAPYAAGLITATILFDEQPGLFKTKYTQSVNAYAQSVPLYQSTIIDRNGSRATLTVIDERDKCVVHINNQMITIAITNISVPTYVHTADGKNFLYIDGIARADGFSGVEGECISVLKLDGELELYDRMPYTFRHLTDNERTSDETMWWLMTNPNSMQFDSSRPVGDMFSHSGAVSNDGTFSFG